VTSGLGLVGIEAGSHDMLLAHAAQARAQDPWQRLMAQALTGRNGQGRPSTSDEAPGRRWPIPSAPIAPRTSARSSTHGAWRSPPHGPPNSGLPHRASPRRQSGSRGGTSSLPTPTTRRTSALPGARHRWRRAWSRSRRTWKPLAQRPTAAPREPITQRLRAMGPADPVVDLERGVHRHGKRMAGDIPWHRDTLRTMAQQDHRSATCLARRETAERGGPTRQATIACVSGSVRQQVRQLGVTQPASSALHAPLMPSSDLERVTSTRTVTQGEALRAGRAHAPPTVWPGGGPSVRCPSRRQSGGRRRPHNARRCCSAPAPRWKDAPGTSRGGITSCEDATTPESGPA
jgi:hypothetical protein